MRLAIAALALCACRAFDPVAEVPHSHREFASTADAIAKIVDENPHTDVFAVGEYHQHRVGSRPLQHFNEAVLPVLAPRAKSLLVEAWAPLPPDVEELMMRSLELHVPAISLPMTAIEYDAVVDASGHLDFLLL